MSVSDARRTLAQALAAAGVRGVYTEPPGSVSPPCVIVACDEPWLEPLTIGRDHASVTVRFRLLCAVAHHDPAGALGQLEALVLDVWRAMPSGTEITAAAAPSLEQVGPSELLTTTIGVELTADA